MRIPHTLKDVRPIITFSDLRNYLTSKEYRQFARWCNDTNREQHPHGVYYNDFKTWVKLQ